MSETLPSADHSHSGTSTSQARRQPVFTTHPSTSTGLPPVFSSTAVAEDNPPRLADGGPFTVNWPASASSSPTPAIPGTQPTTHQISEPQHHSTTSMIGPPMYYEQEHVEAQGNHGFERWIQPYTQGQYPFSEEANTGIPPVSRLPYNSEIVQPSQAGSAVASAPVHGLDASSMQRHPQTPYHFVQGYPVDASGNSGYHQHFIPLQAQNHPTMGVTRTISNQVQTELPSVDYAAPAQRYQPQDYSQGAVFRHHDQHQQQHLPQVMQPQGTSGNQFYYDPVTGNATDVLQSFNLASDHLSVPGPYTPSSDTTAPPSSLSPPLFTGTDDGQSLHSGPSPRPQSGGEHPRLPPSVNAATTSQHFSTSNTVKRDRERPTGKAKSKQSNQKRQRQDSDSGSEDEDDGQEQSTVPPLKGPTSQTRLPGACKHCKRLKMKCDFPPGENTCKRCKQSGHHCIVEGRKPRNTPNKREYLLAQIRQKDAVIESLLKQLHNPYLATPMSIASYRMATSPSDQNNQNVLSWLERMETSVRTAGTSGGAKAFQMESRARSSETGGTVSDDESDDGNDDVTEHGTIIRSQEDADDDEKLFSIPDSTVPIGLIARVSLSEKKSRGKAETPEVDDDDDLGVANQTYFAPGPAYDLQARADLIEQYSPPEIIVHGLVTPDDVTKLFEIFYARLNPHVSLLDPVLHTPQSTFKRCPFLFTVVCAVASRFYAAKSEIYPIAMHFAKHAAANALITGWKSVELAQAYILLSIFGVPAKRWEEDRSWLYIGLALRLATDLNLQRVSTVKPTSEHHEREILNRTRLWINCYNLDRSLSTQYGKPYSIKEDYVIRNSADWYKKSKYNDPLDVGLCGYNALLRIVSRFHDEAFSDESTPTGLNERVNFLQLAREYDARLSANHNEWHTRYTESTDLSDPACVLRMSLLPFVTNYARLVMFSFAFQYVYKRGLQPEDNEVINKCYVYAREVITGMVNDLAPGGFMRYSPDGHFVFATFASAFLLKLLRRDFIPFITSQQRDEIFNLIGSLIDILNSPEIAIDERHTPRLHARFLAQLLSKHRRHAPHPETSHPQYPPQGQMSGGPSGPHFPHPGQSSSSSAHAFSAPPPQGGATGGPGMGHSQGTPYQNVPTTSSSTAPFIEAGYNMTVFDSTDFVPELDASYGEDMYTGALQIFKSPTYWQNALMPGFTWPEARTPDAAQYRVYHGVPNGLNTMQAAAVSMC